MMAGQATGCRPVGTYGKVGPVQPGVASKRFEIVRDLGEGGMGVVYEALERDTGARVALKTLKHTSPEALARLKREFRAMQDLQHPSLVGLRELVFEDGRWFIVMDLVEGVDFISYVRAFPWAREPPEASGTRATGSAPTIRAIPVVSADEPYFDEPKLRAALEQLIEALEACHAAGFVHRDVKPSNVLVTRAGRVVVLDFGLVTRGRAPTPRPTRRRRHAGVHGAGAGSLRRRRARGRLLRRGRAALRSADRARADRRRSARRSCCASRTSRPCRRATPRPACPRDLDGALSRPPALLARRATDGAPPCCAASGARARRPPEDASRSRTLTPPFVGRESGARRRSTTAAAAEPAAGGVRRRRGRVRARARADLVRRFVERIAREDRVRAAC